MKILDRYIFKNLLISGLFVSITLIIVIFLTQSLRFLELVIDSGAQSSTFWTLTILALPRFFEIILPLAIMIATLFTYNRMNNDSEIAVIRAVGHSPLSLAKPAIILGLLVTILLWNFTMWIAPSALAQMQAKRQEIKAQFSSLIFREGVFNQVGKGLTLYANNRDENGTLYGLMIHDNRDSNALPSTIFAKRGTLSMTEQGFRVMVFDGQRQEYNPEKKSLNRLNFQRYAIDLPDSEDVANRWQQPDERTIFELLNPDLNIKRDRESQRDFTVEINRRIIAPLMTMAFTLMSCTALLIGPTNRRGQVKRIIMAISAVIIIQGTYIAAFNLARQHDWGLMLMYILPLAPSLICLALLGGMDNHFRSKNRQNTPQIEAAS